jgi:hypothetical protein
MGEDKIFPAALALGLLLLAALLVIFNSSVAAAPMRPSTSGLFSWGQAPQPELILAELPGSTLIGTEARTSTSPVELGAVDISGFPAFANFEGGRVQNGLLFGDQSLRFAVKDAQSVSFRVAKENGYGPLLVKVNGKTLFDKKAAIGDISIPIAEKGEVIIEIAAASSGWKIWAPSLYDIQGVSIATVKPEQSFSFATGKDAASVLLKIAGTVSGPIEVIMNGQSVFSSAAGAERTELLSALSSPTAADRQNMASSGWTYVSSRFDGRVWYHLYERLAAVGNEQLGHLELHQWLKSENTLAIKAGPGAKAVGSAALQITYLTITEKRHEALLNLSGSQYGKLPGHITFDVLSVLQPGGIQVKLVQGGQTKLAEQFDAIPGAVAVPIMPVNYVAGQAAQLTIEGVDGSLFYVRNLKVWV